MPDGEKSICACCNGLEINSAGGTFVRGRLTQGWLKFQNGTRFDGSFCESGPDYTLKHGKYVCAHTQHTYTGEFLNNVYHGQGSLQWPPDPGEEAGLDPISAGGIFADGELTEGWGVFRDGSRYEGSFCDGFFMHGKHWWDDGQCIYTGGFLDDEFHGQGSVRWLPNQGQEADFDIHSAGGTFVNGCLTQGWIKFCDGSHFEGSFFDSDPPFAFKHGKYRRRTSTGGFLDDKFHGAGVLYNDKFNPWMEKPFSMELAQPNGTFVTVGLVYEGTYENGKKHGRGTWTLRPFTPTLETESFLPITIYEGEWRHGMYHGKGRYTCLPHYERIDEYKSHTSPGSANYNPGKVTKAWHNFEGAEVQGGILECNFEKCRPVGRGKCTFYGSHGCLLQLGLRCIFKEYPGFDTYVVSFEGEIDCPALGGIFITWVDDGIGGPCIGPGNCVVTLSNGDRWEGKLVSELNKKYSLRECGTWTCTDKNGFTRETQRTD